MDVLIVTLWIVLDSVVIATAQLLSGINPPGMEKCVPCLFFVCLLFFKFFFILAP